MKGVLPRLRLVSASAALACVLLFSSSIEAAPRALVPEDFYRIVEVLDPQISPDGQWIAYVATRNDREADESRSALWTVRWDGAERVQLTSSLKDVSSPRWSPDGRTLAFVATPAGAERTALMLLDRRGGEPTVAAALPGDIDTYAWSPDGHQIVAVVSGDGETEAAPKVPKPIVIKARHFKQDEIGYLPEGFRKRLYLIDPARHGAAPLTTDADVMESAPTWSPDGKQIAYVRTRELGPDPDGMEDIVRVPATAGGAPQVMRRIYAPVRQHLEWTADQQSFLFLQGLEARLSAYTSDALMVATPVDGAARPVAPALDRAVTSYALEPGTADVLAIVEDDGSSYPARLSLKSGAVGRLVAGPSTTTGLSAGGTHIAITLATDRMAPEVHALDPGGPRKLSGHNDALLGEVALGVVDDVRFKSPDGAEIHGLVTKPANFVAGRRYPTVLWIHGGPSGEDEHSLIFDRYPLQFERQMLAAQGYVVLAVNYRGSSGRGAVFQRSIAADWCHHEVEDLRAGVDHLIREGIADPERLGIGGWSYGGILTDCTIASDSRFKAAVSGAGSANQLSMLGSDEYVQQYVNEIGTPWKSTALWLKVSYAYFHADRIRTPTLFLGGEKDFNVPIAGGEQMYEALRVLGVPAELVVYPGQYHLFARPSYIVDRATRVRDWYARYLKSGS